MTVSKERKEELIKAFQKSGADSGSADVQIALLTERINSMTSHMRAAPRDYSSRRGLLRMVSKRRSLLDYVRKHDPQRYLEIIGKLNIRK
ncbi:30S ribosomal protein S15 [Pirellula sp. SH-Sr6A]|uniref:30S ribosomal protein S15 n=1 Tax=Pirellula sp. SH-Sr6A TaxID=1632865 RepID=UPI0011BA68DF|nr:30S ribosomal protein S15 [Pirellula sp. SH-Sr6A]